MFKMGKNQKPEPSESMAHEAQPTSIAAPQTSTNSVSPHNSAATQPESANIARSTTSATSRALSENETLARDIKEGVVGGFVGGHTALSGEAHFKGMLRIDGQLSGRVISEKGTLIVSSGAQVNADVEVAVAKINGTVNGDIKTSERLELGRSARVNGNIETPALVIEQGALFEGSCRMQQTPGLTAEMQTHAIQSAKQSQPTVKTQPTTAARKESAREGAAPQASQVSHPNMAQERREVAV